MGSEVQYPDKPEEPLGGRGIQKHYGIVMVLDALGTRSLDLDDAVAFLELKDSLLRWHLTMQKGFEIVHFVGGSDSFNQVGLWTFGDTLIFTRSLAMGNEQSDLLEFSFYAAQAREEVMQLIRPPECTPIEALPKYQATQDYFDACLEHYAKQ